MNIEEAKANIGAEVVLLEDTKPYTWEDSDGVFTHTEHSNVSKLYGALRIVSVDDCTITIKGESKYQEAFCPHHIALKEPKMQNYKIKVANEAESKEAQVLFFELGYYWYNLGKEVNYLKNKFLFVNGIKQISRHNDDDIFSQSENQEITLPQLRDLAVLHRNDVSDATHDAVDGNKYYVGCEVYYWSSCSSWIVSNSFAVGDVSSRLKPITQEEQMTWQDALRAVADGKEVERLKDGEWQPINDKFKNEEYRLAPQRKELNGNFTKEELLKIAGEMV